MTALIDATTAPAQPDQPGPGGPEPRGWPPFRLIRAEMLKIWTTNVWWILAICSLAVTALALAGNMLMAQSELSQARNPPDFGEQLPPDQRPPQEEIDQMRASWAANIDLAAILVKHAANIFTSGQRFGLLIVMIIGALIVTNEFFHQTATATFLITPRRTEVILAKLAAAVSIAAGFWAVTTAIDLVAGGVFFAAQGESNSLGDWSVLRALLLNLVAYGIWAVFGVGFGVLIRSQLWATIVGAVLYLVGGTLAPVAFLLVHEFLIKKDWVLTAVVILPSMASGVMISPTKLWEQSPPAWVGAAILIGYGVIAGVIGTLVTRKRDIS